MSIFARRLAAVVSRIGHPLVFVTATIAIVVATQLAARMAFAILAALLVSVIGPTAILLIRGVRFGRWQDADVSVQDERRRFYPIAIGLSALGTLLTWWIGAPTYILRGGIVALSLLIIAALVNHRSKISLHMLFATFCTAILFRLSPIYGGAAFLLAALIFWSRLFLMRHTLTETISGLILGLAGGIAAAWL